MEYSLTELQKTVKQMARTIAQDKMLPLRAELDQKEEFPRSVIQELADTDLLGVYIPEKYGGLGGGCFELCLVTEELSRICAGLAVSYAVNALGSMILLEYGSEEQKQRYLPDIARGKKLAAFALTEESAGSDAGAIKTTATRMDNGYILNGTKQFITNGGEADIYTIIALTDKERGIRGASALLVDKETPGFTFGRKEKKLGIRASITRELIFEDSPVPLENLISKEGMGFPMTMRLFDRSRPGIGAQAVGLAQGALEAALDYAKQRNQFGQPIISFQAVSHMLADMAIRLEAARALVYTTARTVDSGTKNFSTESAMAKVFASDAAMQITIDAVQVFGGVGYMQDYPVEKMMRDAKITQIYEGTNQILRDVIASGLRKKTF
ncbi:MAG: acyl-CoA dehydrogenase family protein [Dehalococcoidia bacterium]|nr:MAG: acyl-CoA dehydrogenase family protein [Dehalococcoidia bacterium]